MAGRPPGSEDKDQLFLDRLIALALDVIERANEIKEISDEPEIVLLALEIEGRGLIMQGITKRYRGRIKELKKLARCLQTAGQKAGKG
jgi:hypothetical protein